MTQVSLMFSRNTPPGREADAVQFIDTPCTSGALRSADNSTTAFTRTVNQVELHNPVAIILPEEPTSANGTGQSSIDELEKVLDEEFTVQLIRLEKEFWQSDNGQSQLTLLASSIDLRGAASETTDHQR